MDISLISPNMIVVEGKIVPALDEEEDTPMPDP